MKLASAALIMALLTTPAFAKCPAKAPNASRFNVLAGDQRVSGNWLKKTLIGKKLSYGDVGVEHYNADGTYSWSTGIQSWSAPGVKFYKSGFRCIDYPSPRFDLYVVRDKRIVLINGVGERYVARLSK